MIQLSPLVAVDIGGTKINIGEVSGGKVTRSHKLPFCASKGEDDILTFIIGELSKYIKPHTRAIAIGVPSIVDTETGTILDAVNIPAWQKFSLKNALEQQFSIPVYLNNDVNCFVVGEHQYGNAKKFDDVIGLCLGTGLGSGIILQNRLYAGQNCAAGELGAIPYQDAFFDDFCSGKFFKDHYGLTGDKVATKAMAGDALSRQAFAEFGEHLAQAISHLLLILDPQHIVLGGSVSKSFSLFEQSLWNSLKKFPYQSALSNLTIEFSDNENSALLGAAYLCQQWLFQSEEKKHEAFQ